MKQIAFATYDTCPGLIEDDRQVMAPLESLGFTVTPLVWDQSEPLLERFDAVVIRSCWDYHLKTMAFRSWIDRLEALRIPVWNPAPVLRWNLEKTYLAALASRGALLPKTVWLERGAKVNLAQVLQDHCLESAVVKPSISLSAYRTWRTSPAEAPGQQAALDALLEDCGAMLQAFVPEVLTGGELSLVFFGERYSHSVRKRPRAGDFRVQEEFGGTRERLVPSPSIIRQAEAILETIDHPLLYARVDGIEVNGALMLMELELIDPVLFFHLSPEAPERFARTLVEYFSRG